MQFAEATFDTQSKEAVISGKLDGITLFDEMQLEDIDILLEWIEDKTIGNPFGLNRLRITLSATITPFSKRVEVKYLILMTALLTLKQNYERNIPLRKVIL